MQKSCLLFVYSARPGSLKERQKFVNVCLFGRARKVKRKAKGCLLFYPAGPESSKESQKVVYCLFIRQGQKVKKEGKRLFIVCLSCRAGKFKRKAKSCLLFVYAAGRESLKE